MARVNAKRPRSASGGYAPEETRRALVQSALELFGEKGYAATSVQEITEAAGVTKGAFYHHFESKEDLLRLIHDEFVDEQLAALKQVLADYDDPAEQLLQLLRIFLASVERFRSNVSVFFQERRYLTGARFKAVKEKRDEFDRLFRLVIERGIESGVFRNDIDPRIVGFGILGMCAWTNQWFRSDGRYSADEIAGMYASVALDGLRKD